jgi:quercetin dioxygenase-like cupin family protein
MNSIHKGNAIVDGRLTREWIVGHFMPEGDIRNTSAVEIKWGNLKKGDRRTEWVTGEHRTAIAILISGKQLFEFPDEKVELNHQGDYVMWGIGVDHRWEALEDTVIITVRWPSVS